MSDRPDPPHAPVGADPATAVERADCCVGGGGPAGAVLALLLARQGVAVTLLEAHGDFDRDFRGDGLQPAALDLLGQMGLADRLLALALARVPAFPVRTPSETVAFQRRQPAPDPVPVHDHRAPGAPPRPGRRGGPALPHLPAGHGRPRRGPGPGRRRARPRGALPGPGRVARGPHAAGGGGRRALLPAAGPGRAGAGAHRVAGRPALVPAAPAGDRSRRRGLRRRRRLAALQDRGAEWQVGYSLAKGGYARLRAEGLEALRRSVGLRVPWLAGRTDALRDWSQTSLLAVEVCRLRRWYRPGLLLLGDAAHTMSPVGGVGISVALQDAAVAVERPRAAPARGAACAWPTWRRCSAGGSGRCASSRPTSAWCRAGCCRPRAARPPAGSRSASACWPASRSWATSGRGSSGSACGPSGSVRRPRPAPGRALAAAGAGVIRQAPPAPRERSPAG